MENICWFSLDEITPNARNARTHSRKQIEQIANSIRAFGFLVPILIDEKGIICAGHGRYAAAQQLELKKVPVLKVTGLSDAKLRAFAIADNRIAAGGGWDRKRLAIELPELADILVVDGLDISITGFSAMQIPALAIDFNNNASGDETIEPQWNTAPPLSQLGDLWQLDQHRLLCGDACNPDHVARLMQGGRAAMAFLNPPVRAFAHGRGQAADLVASSEAARDRIGRHEVLRTALTNAASVSRDGALHYVCTDWRHIGELVELGGIVYDQILNIAVWVQSEAGEGFPYRNQHRLIAVFRVSNDVDQKQVGRRQRKRSDVWRYGDERVAHVVPVALIADAIKDCTRRGDIVLDLFGGTGTTLVAAERVGRVAYALDAEPRLADAAIRRWQALSGKDAVCAESGLTCRELASRGGDVNTEQPN